MDFLEAEREYTDEVIGDDTIPEMVEESFERNSSRTAQHYKGGIYDRSLPDGAVPRAPDGEFESLTYGEVQEVVHALAAGFRDLGVRHGDRVAIHANTRMEWAQTDFALLAAGAVVTTVYTGSSPRQVRYLLDDPGAVGVVTENQELLERVLEVEDDLDLEFIVVIDEVDGYGDRDDVHELGEVVEVGRNAFDPGDYQDWLDATEPEDLASLIYTSGTTGRPKGVRLTHRNFRSNVNQVRKRFGPRPDKPEDAAVIDEDTRAVSYLPLAHVFERLAGHFLLFGSGASVAYAENPDTLREDFGKVQPTTATSVPRVYEKIYEAIEEQAGDGVKRRIFDWATGVGKRHFESDDPGLILGLKYGVADKLVFENVREALGGEVELLISGGGSLSPDLCRLYHAMGLPIYEGYGLTETSPVVSSNPPEAVQIGSLGPPVVDLETRVDISVRTESSVEEVEGELGELLVRGPNVTDGYWNQPEETEAAFTEVPASEASGESEDSGSSGKWFRTGDIIEVQPDGYLVFHERAKQIIVLSTGKNVAPQPIENRFVTSSLVEQAMVVGNERKFISALIVPNHEAVRRRADQEGVTLPDDPEELVGHDVLRQWIQEEVDRVNREFESYETIKKFRLVPDEFTEENGLLTPTMKKKRHTILDKYEDLVDGMYDEE